MAEAIAVISFLSAICSLATYGNTVVMRLIEFRNNVKDLPASFTHISVQLPLLVEVVRRLSDHASEGEIDSETEKLLAPVVQGLHDEIRKLDAVLKKILPSAKASTWEKGVKAVKSVGIQKDVDNFAAVIRDYVSNLTAFQTTHNSDLIRRLGTFLEEQRATSLTPEPTPTISAIWLNKYDSDTDFVGREDIIVEVERQLKEKNHRAALAGIGGVGKSRVAIQYCHLFRQRHPETHILWVYGGTKFRFETDYQRIAKALIMPVQEDDKIDMLRMVCDWLSDAKNGYWLMVLDNADDEELWLGSNTRTPSGNSLPLIDYLPRCDHGGILITTRDSQLGHRLTESKQIPIEIIRFEPAEARVLLSAKLAEDKSLSRENADELTSALEYLPLTITQAAAYLRQIDISVSEYLELFRKGEAGIPNLLDSSIDDPGRDRETSNSVFQTWRLSFEQISKQNPHAANILSLMAVLDRQAIPEGLLRGREMNVLEFKAAVSKLKAFSLINVEKSSSKYSIHRLVQLSTQKWLEHHGTLLMWQELALAAVARVFPANVEFGVWQLIQDLNSHAQIVLRYSFSTRSCQVARADILHGMGHYYLEQGQDLPALEILSQCRELRVENLGPEHEDTLTTIGLLSVAYSKLDYGKEAYELGVALWETAERALGPSHRLTLRCMSRLAITYGKKRDFERAEELQLQTLKAMEQTFGLEDKITMTEMNNLAFTYNKLQKWQEAEGIGLRALDLRTRVLGPAHPDTLTSMAGLAWTYRSQNRWEETEQLERKALAQRLQCLGPDHPKTLRTMASLAIVYARRGGWSEAEILRKDVLDTSRRLLGANHKDTLRAGQELAQLRSAMQRIEGNRTPNSRLTVAGANETRFRNENLRPTDTYRPSYGRHQSAGSLSPCGPGGYDYRPRTPSPSPYGEHGMNRWRSPNWREK